MCNNSFELSVVADLKSLQVQTDTGDTHANYTSISCSSAIMTWVSFLERMRE